MIGACMLVVKPVCDPPSQPTSLSLRTPRALCSPFQRSMGLDGVSMLCCSTLPATGGVTAPQPHLRVYIYIERYIDIFFAPF